MGPRRLASPPLPPDLSAYRARLLAHCFDYYAEAWNVRLHPAWWSRLQEARTAAEEADANGRDPALCDVGGREFAVMPYGAKGGVQFVLEDATVRVALASPNRSFSVVVRYLASGLWNGGGLSERRRDVAEWLRRIADAEEDDWEPNIVRFDYAFDFHSPDFTAEAQEDDFRRRFLCPAHTNGDLHWEGTTTETITLGKMPRLQVQVYDKGREIVAASKKDWLLDAWALGLHREWPNGLTPPALAAVEAANPFMRSAWTRPPEGEPAADVWRVELRYGGEWLKERGIRGFPAMEARLPELLSAGLIDRRLTARDNRRLDLRPIHPIWWVAHQAAGAATTAPPVVTYTTLAKSEYRDLIETQMAGMLRSLSVSQTGTWNAAMGQDAFLAALRRAESDPASAAKIKRARARFRYLGSLQ